MMKGEIALNLNKNVVVREETIDGLGDVILIFNLNSETLIILYNEVSKDMWKKLLESNNIEITSNYIAKKYRVDKEKVIRDLYRFIEKLREGNLIC